MNKKFLHHPNSPKKNDTPAIKLPETHRTNKPKALSYTMQKIMERHGTQAKKITLPSDFHERRNADKIEYLHQLSSAINHALAIKVDEFDAISEENERLRKLNSNADTAVQQHKTNAFNGITELNARLQEQGQEILRLKERNNFLEGFVEAHDGDNG